jgi:hypothetical protein
VWRVVQAAVFGAEGLVLVLVATALLAMPPAHCVYAGDRDTHG